MNAFQDSFAYLIDAVIGIYMLLVLLRFLFQWLRVDFRNPLVAPIVTITQPPLRVLRRYVPGLFGVDLSALLFLLILGVVKFFALGMLGGQVPGIGGVLVGVIAEMLNTAFWVFIIAIFVQAVLSWFMPGGHHPATRLLYELTAPVLAPIRRMLPAVSGLDFSPIIALIGLNFLRKLLVSPLMSLAAGMM